MTNIGYKIVYYGKTIFAFPHFESHFIKPNLREEFLDKYMKKKKVDIQEYLSHEGYSYLAEVVKKWNLDYAETMFNSVSNDGLTNLLENEGIYNIMMN